MIALVQQIFEEGTEGDISRWQWQFLLNHPLLAALAVLLVAQAIGGLAGTNRRYLARLDAEKRKKRD